MINKSLFLLCILLIPNTANADFILPDTAEGFTVPYETIQSNKVCEYLAFNGHISSDGMGGYYTPNGHVSSDGMGGYYTPNGHVSSDGMGGYYY